MVSGKWSLCNCNLHFHGNSEAGHYIFLNFEKHSLSHLSVGSLEALWKLIRWISFISNPKMGIFEGGNGKPLWNSCRESAMDRGSWRTTPDGVVKSWIQLSTHTRMPSSLLPILSFSSGGWKLTWMAPAAPPRELAALLAPASLGAETPPPASRQDFSNSFVTVYKNIRGLSSTPTGWPLPRRPPSSRGSNLWKDPINRGKKMD